jgi:hypothetical protein
LSLRELLQTHLGMEKMFAVESAFYRRLLDTSIKMDASKVRRSPDEPTGRANARPMTGSATSGIFMLASAPHIAALMRATC